MKTPSPDALSQNAGYGPPTLSTLRILFHPLSAFRDDLKHNALTRLHWGLEPANPKRRRLALLNAIFPSGLYLLVYAIFLASVVPNNRLSGSVILSARDMRELSFALLTPTILGGLFWMAPFLILSVFRLSPPPGLLPNIADYSQAGLGGGRILWGFAGLELTALLAACGLHLVLFIPTIALYGVYTAFDSNFFFLFVLGLVPIAIVALFSLLRPPLWVLMPQILGRIVLLCLLGGPIPLLIGLAVAFAVPSRYEFWFQSAVFGEAASWLPRFALCGWMWRRAKQKLTLPRLQP